MTTIIRPRRRRTGPAGRKLIAVLASLLMLGLVATGFGAAGPAAEAAEPGAFIIFDDQIGNGFGNWSWAVVDLDQTSTVAEGQVAAAVDAGPWQALYFGTNEPKALPLNGTLRFQLHGGSSDSPIGVRLLSPSGDSGSIAVQPAAGAWTAVELDLADLGGFDQINGLWFDNQSGQQRPTYYVDDVRIVAGEAPPPSTGPVLEVDLGPRTVTRTVTDPASGVVTDQVVSFPHPISDGIYGMNFVTDAVREELDVSVNRWGGNGTERYNHDIATANNANDWFFMNNPGELGGDHRFEDDNQADGAATILTLPMSGWVAKNREANCAYPTNDALGPEHNAGAQDAEEPHWVDQRVRCGNGFRNGERLPSPDPTVTSMAVDESFSARWVAEMVDDHGTAAEGGVEYYALGNEPGLWHSTHADIRPDPIGRTELIDRNQTWARAVKAVDPSADVIGPVLWSGYSYYVTSEEVLRGDRPGPGTPTFVADYLAAMRSASEQEQTRLLDALAVNFYDDRVYSGGSDALRLESTRNLWDPSYAPSDWWVIRDFLYGDGSAVIPRLQSLIDQNYPDTDLAITEYNFGGNDTLAGGLAQADALGIFGREDLDVATIWDPWAAWTGLTPEEWAARPVIDAFRLYRNYDGAGSRFGDVSVYASSSDEAQVAIHAATRSSDGALTLLIINKGTTAIDSPLTIDRVGGSAERYQYSAATEGSIARLADVDLGAGQTVVELPARSATLLVAPNTFGVGPGPAPIIIE